MADELSEIDPPDGWRREPASPFDELADPDLVMVWRCAVGDGSIEVELYDYELYDFPPLADARARTEALEQAIRTHRAWTTAPGRDGPGAVGDWALWAVLATPTGADK